MIRNLDQSGRGRRFDRFRALDVYAWIMSASRQEVSCGVRVELRKSLESILGQLDISTLPPDSSQEFALLLLVENGRFLPALGVRALRARLYRIENPLIASEMTRAFSLDNRHLPLRVYSYEENGATVLLTYDQPSSVLPAKKDRGSLGMLSAQQQPKDQPMGNQ